MPHRRQPVEGSMESTDQVTALTASDQYTEGILLSTQDGCIVIYVVIVSSVQVVCIVIIASSTQCDCIVGILSSTQSDCIVGVSSSTQSDCIVGNLSSVQVVCIVGNLSSVQVVCIVIYVVKANSINVRNMLTI